jgi:hypothetical protein
LRLARTRCGIGLWATLLTVFLAALFNFEAESLARGCTNEPQRAFVAEMERVRLPGEWVMLDQGVVGPAERLGYLQLLEWSGQKVGDARLIRGGIWDELAERPSFLTVVSQSRAMMAFERQGVPIRQASAGLVRLDPGTSDESGRAAAGGTGLYRVTAEGATLLAWQPGVSCDQETSGDREAPAHR